MYKKFKWTLFSLLTAVTLCGCTETIDDPSDDPSTGVIEEITPTKEGIISWINEYFSDLDNMTPFGIKGTFVRNQYEDTDHTVLVDTTNPVRDMEYYGTTDFIYSYYYNGSWYQPTYNTYFQKENKVCRQSLVLDYYNYNNPENPLSEPDITHTHRCIYDTTTEVFTYSDLKVNEYYDTERPISLYGLTRNGTYDLSQYEWVETEEENTWTIDDYYLWELFVSKTPLGYDGTFDYWTTITINESGNLEITATLAQQYFVYDITFELTEVGTISKTLEDIEELYASYITKQYVWYYSDYVGSNVVKYIYTREDDNDTWSFVEEDSSNSYSATVGTQVGLRLTKTGSTLLNIWEGEYDYDFLSYDKDDDLYYFTMPNDAVYLSASWS